MEFVDNLIGNGCRLVAIANNAKSDKVEANRRGNLVFCDTKLMPNNEEEVWITLWYILESLMTSQNYDLLIRDVDVVQCITMKTLKNAQVICMHALHGV